MPKLLIIGFTWPEPSTTAAGHHMMQLVTAFQNRGYDVFFTSTASKTEYSINLNEVGIEEIAVRLNHSSFDDFIKELQPSIVIFDRFMVEEQFGWRVAEECPNALRILNTEDLHSLRESREIAHGASKEFKIADWLQSDKTKREVASVYRSDLTLLVSTFEKQLLEETIGISNEILLHLPFLLNEIDAETIAKWPSFEERNDFIAFGNGKHAPNIDSFKFLKTLVWPLIQKELPEAKLHIYGAYLPKQVLEMHNPTNGFLVHGWIEDLKTEIQARRVVLAPLRFGAGIKGKLVDAFANGTPTISTSLGAEGIQGAELYEGIVETDAKIIAQRAIDLYRQKEKWEKTQKQGIAIFNQNFDKLELEQAFFKKIALITTDLEAHRQKNFVGSLLMHQNMAATKFMGKWIEEKSNKN